MSSKPVERHERLGQASAARAQRDPGVGLLIIASGVAIFLVAAFAVWVVRQTLVKSDQIGVVLLPVFLFCWAVVANGRRIVVSEGERVLAEDPRAPIVYLRPFATDDTQADTPWSSRVRQSPWEPYITHEQRLARTLRKVGPFVAVGDPTEDMPQLGAARVYATDEDWRTAIGELTAAAAAVLLQTGDSDGLAWEVQHVAALGAPERVILALPPPGRRKTRRRRYEAFRERFGDRFPRHLPESIGDCQFAYFDTDWTPRLLGGRGVPLPVGDAPREVALRRLAREFKIKWGPRWARYLANFTALLAATGVVLFLTGDLASSLRVDDCVTASVPQLKARKPPFATSDSAVRKYVRADCQALEDKHLLGDGRLGSPAATRMRCQRYTGALYDYEPAERRGPRGRWEQVATRYCATPAGADPGGMRLLQTAADVNRPDN